MNRSPGLDLFLGNKEDRPAINLGRQEHSFGDHPSHIFGLQIRYDNHALPQQLVGLEVFLYSGDDRSFFPFPQVDFQFVNPIETFDLFDILDLANS